MRWNIIIAIVALLILTALTGATWTPYEDIDLWCVYEEFNVTNMTICGNLSMGDSCGSATECLTRLRIIPNQSGYVYFWSDGKPFYFNQNVTVNGSLIVVNIAELNLTGNLNMNKYNITEVSWMSIDNLVNNSGGDEVLVHASFVMMENNITRIGWAIGEVANFTVIYGNASQLEDVPGMSKWTDEGDYIKPNSTYAINVLIEGWLNVTNWFRVWNDTEIHGNLDVFGNTTVSGELNVSDDSNLQNVTMDTVKKIGVGTHYYIDSSGALIIHLEP